MDFTEGFKHGGHDLFRFFPAKAAVLPDVFVHGTAVQIFHHDIVRLVFFQLVIDFYHVGDLFFGHDGHGPGFSQESVRIDLKHFLLSGRDIRRHILPPPHGFGEIFLHGAPSLKPLVIGDVGDADSAASDDPADHVPFVAARQFIARLQAIRGVR